MRSIWGIVRLVIVLTGWMAGSVIAQDVGVVQSEILVLDPDRLFAETKLGKRINADFLAELDKLSELNNSIASELEAEEKALTALRSEKTADEFRILADEFDTKVKEIRRERDRKLRDLERNRERAPGLFMRTVQPVLVQLMREAGGAVVMDIRSVLLRADVIDITDVAISRVDASIGDGKSDAPNGEQ